LHPLEQNGAWSEVVGLPHIGQPFVLISSFLGMAAGDGETSVRAQADSAAHLPRQGLQPTRPLLKHRNHRRVRYESNRSGPARGLPQHRPRLECGAIRSEFEQRSVLPRAYDLKKAESVYGGPLEWLWQDAVDDAGDLLPFRLPGNRLKIDSDRSADPVAQDRPSRSVRSREGQLERGQRAVDVDQRHRCGKVYAELSAGKSDSAGARLIEEIRPTRIFEAVMRRGERH